MEIKRQIEFDKQILKQLETSINETTEKFNDTLKLVSELTERLAGLREQKKDFMIRIAVREQELINTTKK